MDTLLSSSWTPICVAALGVIGASLAFSRKSSPWDDMYGPPSRSFVFGHLRDFMKGEVGDKEFEWLEKYGPAYPFKGIFGIDRILVSDPKAMQFIFGTPATGHMFTKGAFARAFIKDLLGRGIIWAEAQDHSRHRRIMMPAFNAPQIRALLPIFSGAGERLVKAMREDLSSASSKVMNVHGWLAATTLDVIGEAAFDYRFGTLEKEKNELASAYNNLLQDTVSHPTDGFIIFASVISILPMFIIELLRKLPLKQFDRIRTCQEIANRTSQELLDKKMASGEGGPKDIMTLLVKANIAAEGKAKMNDEEVMSQMMTILLAGHETTANSTSWTMFELAKDLDLQKRVRQEIRTVREEARRKGEAELTTAQLDQMVLLGAVTKEALRFHPVVYHTQRVAAMDTAIPLSNPIKTKSGKYISEIPIKEGQMVVMSQASFQRSKQYWGEDAHEFRVERWLEKDRPVTGVGVFADLMVFASGHRACLGWRFSVLEMQALLVEMISNFEFSIPEGSKRIVRDASGVMSPQVDGEPSKGAQLPLLVRPLDA